MKLQYLVVATAVGVSAGCTFAEHIEDGKPTVTASNGSYRIKADRNYTAPKVRDGRLIKTFSEHNFSSACFDTLRCRVLYNNRYVTDDTDPRGPLTESVLRRLSGRWLGIKNFPRPIQVSWTSKDGVEHEAEVDIANIFHSQLVRYAPDLDIRSVDLEGYYFSPDIVLVVENRSIHIYMKAWVWLLQPADENHKRPDFREDMVLAYTNQF